MKNQRYLAALLPVGLIGSVLLALGMASDAATAVHIPNREKPAIQTFTIVHVTEETLSAKAEAQAAKMQPQGMFSADKKTLTFSQRQVRLVVASGPSSDMLSYRIAGIKNPTLSLQKGATLSLLFINTDDDMTHNLRIGSQHTASASSVGTMDLAHKTRTTFHAANLTLRVPAKSGTYYYFCTIPGHVQGGMWGTVLVR